MEEKWRDRLVSGLVPWHTQKKKAKIFREINAWSWSLAILSLSLSLSLPHSLGSSVSLCCFLGRRALVSVQTKSTHAHIESLCFAFCWKEYLHLRHHQTPHCHILYFLVAFIYFSLYIATSFLLLLEPWSGNQNACISFSFQTSWKQQIPDVSLRLKCYSLLLLYSFTFL